MPLRFPIMFFGLLIGLQTHAGLAATTIADRDPSRLELASVTAMVVDAATNEVIYSHHPDRVVPVASISKLVTAMVVLDAEQPLNEMIPVRIEQTRELQNVFSRIRIGSVISRRDMLLMTLMSSENRAAASLAHHYPGGYNSFIAAMNAKARALGMVHTRFVEPTGLSERNVSTARELTLLVRAAAQYPLINELSTTPKKDMRFTKPQYTLAFYNTNPLIHNGDWNIQLHKTGFNNQAGRCLVMLTVINERPLVLVLLDSFGKRSHFGDASRIRQWLATGSTFRVPAPAKAYHQRKLNEIAALDKTGRTRSN